MRRSKKGSNFLIKAADETTMVTVRNYQIKTKPSLEAGIICAFIHVLRKFGDEVFWTTQNSNIVEWVPLTVPDSVISSPVSSSSNSPRKLRGCTMIHSASPNETKRNRNQRKYLKKSEEFICLDSCFLNSVLLFDPTSVYLLTSLLELEIISFLWLSLPGHSGSQSVYSISRY